MNTQAQADIIIELTKLKATINGFEEAHTQLAKEYQEAVDKGSATDFMIESFYIPALNKSTIILDFIKELKN
jgi:hypothetical protein